MILLLLSAIPSHGCPEGIFDDQLPESVVDTFRRRVQMARTDLGAHRDSISAYRYRVLSISSQYIRLLPTLSAELELKLTEAALEELALAWDPSETEYQALIDMRVEAGLSVQPEAGERVRTAFRDFVQKKRRSTDLDRRFQQRFAQLDDETAAFSGKPAFDPARFKGLLDSVQSLYARSETAGRNSGRVAIGQLARYWHSTSGMDRQVLLESVLGALRYARTYGDITYFIRCLKEAEAILATKELSASLQNSSGEERFSGLNRLYRFAREKSVEHSSTTYRKFLAEFGTPLY